MFIAMIFTIAKMWKRSRCPSADEQVKKNVVDILFSFHKEGNPAICDSMDEPRGRHAKPVTDGQILHDSTLHEVFRIVKLTESEDRMVAARGWGAGAIVPRWA